MSTFIEKYFAEKARVEQTMPTLRTFFDQPAVLGALRLVLAGLMGKTKTSLKYAIFEKEFAAFTTKVGRPTPVGEHELKRQILQLVNTPDDPNLRSMLGLYCAHLLSQDLLLADDERLQPGLSCVNFVSRLRKFIQDKDQNALKVQADEVDLPRSAEHADYTRNAESKDKFIPDSWGQKTERQTERLNRAFFHWPENFRPDVADRSYYFAYRFSTEKGRIVKTLITISNVSTSGLDHYSFQHVYFARGGVERVVEGRIALFERNVYLVGQAARRLPQGIDTARALKAIALYAPDLEVDYRRAAGVFLSTALNWQPIVGRIVMLHIGFQSKIKEPAERELGLRANLEVHELKDDLAKSLGLEGGTNAKSDPQELSEFVLDHMNNHPYFDRSGPELAQGLQRSLAIEDKSQPRP